jgi:hypothetical protein
MQWSEPGVTLSVRARRKEGAAGGVERVFGAGLFSFQRKWERDKYRPWLQSVGLSFTARQGLVESKTVVNSSTRA